MSEALHSGWRKSSVSIVCCFLPSSFLPPSFIILNKEHTQDVENNDR